MNLCQPVAHKENFSDNYGTSAAFCWPCELVFTVNTTCRSVPKRSRELDLVITSRELEENYALPLVTR